MTKENLKNVLTVVRKMIRRSSETAETAQTTADNAQTTADNAQTTADNAQTTAETAQTTAETAQTTADNAQATAETAQTTADNAQTSINDSFIQRQKEFLFDKKTVGRDSFRFNAFGYYKISEFAPSKESVVSFEGTRENGESWSRISHGTGCDEYGLFIVVTSTNNPTLPSGDAGSSVEISPPSTGLYAMYEVGNASVTAGTAKFTLTGKQAVVLVSSTPNSTKKFKVTVDDAGILSATEVTDTTT